MQHMFKVIRLNTQITMTLPWIARFRSNFYRVWPWHSRYTTNVHGQRSRPQSNVAYQQWKCNG